MNTSTNTYKRTWKPGSRGDLFAATDSRKALLALAPESPRPVELLEGIQLVGTDKLTATDTALYELLMSQAYATDPEFKVEALTIPAQVIKCYLGGARRKQIEDSLGRLADTWVRFDLTGADKTRHWGKVPLVLTWMSSPENDEERDQVHFSLPAPMRKLMLRPQRYRYVELAAIARMKSKYGVRLYKKLLVRAGADLENVLEFEAEPEEVAKWLGYESHAQRAWHFGQFKLRVLDPALEDMKLVSAFSVSITEIRAKGRGAPIAKLKFKISVGARSLLSQRAAPVARPYMTLYTKPDHPDLQVSAKVWLRARKAFRIWDSGASMMAKAWQAAIAEAIKQPKLEIVGKEYRGAKLLAAIGAMGADQTAWRFIQEELRVPDLTLVVAGDDYKTQIKRDADGHARKKTGKPLAELLASEPVVTLPAPQISTLAAFTPLVSHADADVTKQAWALHYRFRGGRDVRPTPIKNLKTEIMQLVPHVPAELVDRVNTSLSVDWGYYQEGVAEEVLRYLARYEAPTSDDEEDETELNEDGSALLDALQLAERKAA